MSDYINTNKQRDAFYQTLDKFTRIGRTETSHTEKDGTELRQAAVSALCEIIEHWSGPNNKIEGRYIEKLLAGAIKGAKL